MSSISLEPYLNFDGTCEEAMNFYKSIFGGDLQLMKFGQMPMPGSTDDPEKIMHSTLKSPEITFMGSDGGDTGMASNIQMSLSGTDQKLKAYFDALAVGGEVTLPIMKQAWGDEFGMLTDKYGVKWMVNIGTEATA